MEEKQRWKGEFHLGFARHAVSEVLMIYPVKEKLMGWRFPTGLK